jgi:hypothetical protein
MNTKALLGGSLASIGVAAATAPWWAPLVVQLGSVLLAYMAARISEKRKQAPPVYSLPPAPPYHEGEDAARYPLPPAPQTSRE